jgi:alkaline phosphatase D
MKSTNILFIVFFLFFSCDKKYPKTIIAFGSCSHEFDSVQMWDNIISHNPMVWIWMGDNIYGDTYDKSVMEQKYNRQKKRPSYQRLLQATKVYGIWDDHDYGINDGGREYLMKDESKKLMLDFLDVPQSNLVWQREGAYQAYDLEIDEIRIKLILLDTRYFRDSLERNLNPPPNYVPNYSGTILGEAQWEWFESELANSDADIHLIGSSIQAIPNDHGYEKWGNFPNERQRLFDLIVKTAPARPIILSGDRHIAEFSKIDLEGLDYPLYEFTSSGLTHSWNTLSHEDNRYRIGELVINKNFGIIEIEHRGMKRLSAYRPSEVIMIYCRKQKPHFKILS